MRDSTLTLQEMRIFMPSNMDATPRLTYEQARDRLLEMVVDGSILMDRAFEHYPVPISAIEADMMVRMGMDVSNIKPAVPEEVTRIMQFFDWMKLIREGMAE